MVIKVIVSGGNKMKSKFFMIMFVSILFFVLPITSKAEENNTNTDTTASYVIELPTELKTVEVKGNVDLAVLKKYQNGTTEKVDSGIQWGISDSSMASIKDNQFITNKIGKVMLTAKMNDGQSNSFIIKIVDTKKPVLSGVSNKTVYLKSKFDAKSGVKATDKYDGDITKKIIVKGKVNTQKTGKYTLTYSVKDSSGNKTVTKRIITVKKNNFRKFTKEGVTLFVHKNLVDAKGKDVYVNTVALVPATDKQLKFMALVGASGNLNVEKLVVAANNKKKTFKLDENGLILEDAQFAFFKKNISLKHEVKVTFTTSQKTFAKTLSKKEIQALVDAIKLYEEW